MEAHKSINARRISRDDEYRSQVQKAMEMLLKAYLAQPEYGCMIYGVLAYIYLSSATIFPAQKYNVPPINKEKPPTSYCVSVKMASAHGAVYPTGTKSFVRQSMLSDARMLSIMMRCHRA